MCARSALAAVGHKLSPAPTKPKHLDEDALGGMTADQLKRYEGTKEGNQRLKQAVSNPILDELILRNAPKGNC